MITAIVLIALLGLASTSAKPQTGDNSGQYVPDNSGQYVPDGAGKYTPQPQLLARAPLTLAPTAAAYPFAAQNPLYYPQYQQFPQYQQYNQLGRFNQYPYAPLAQYPQIQQLSPYRIASTPAPFIIRASSPAAQSISTTPAPIQISSTPAPTGSSTARPLLTQPLTAFSRLAAQPNAINLLAQPQIAPIPGFIDPYAAPNPNNYFRILRLEQDQDEAAYRYAYETENGIAAGEEGHLDQNPTDPANPILRATGSYSYVGPDGVQYTTTYTADERGFRAYGAHLPTPPPPPAHVVRQLDYLAANGLLKK